MNKFKEKTSLIYSLIFTFPIIAYALKIQENISNLKISDWPLSELLINYQGGFVRRGLLGEWYFMFPNPIDIATNVQKLALIIVLIGLITLIFLEKDVYTQTVFSAGVVYAPAALEDFSKRQFEYLDRKEIYFYLILILIIFLLKCFPDKFFTTVAVSVLTSITVLIHEAFFIVVFAILVVLLMFSRIYKIRFSKKFIISLFTICLINVFCFIATITHRGDSQIAQTIVQSYSNTVPIFLEYPGAIEALSWNFADANFYAVQNLTIGSIYYYLFFLILTLSFIAMFVLTSFSEKIHRRLAFLLCILLMVGFILVGLVSWDWGRLISTYFFSTMFSILILKQILFNEKINYDAPIGPTTFSSQKNNIKITLIVFCMVLSIVSWLTQVELYGPHLFSEIFLRHNFYFGSINL